jgi:hypothetical protein
MVALVALAEGRAVGPPSRSGGLPKALRKREAGWLRGRPPR